MSETIPLTSVNDFKPTEIDHQAHEMEDEIVPLVESNEVHGYTQLEWDLFWGFSVDYELKFNGILHRMKYNMETFKLNYIILFSILFSISFLVKPIYGLIHLVISLVFIIIFFNQKSPVVRFYLKITPVVLLILYFMIYIIFILFAKSFGLTCVLLFSMVVCLIHMILKTSTLELVDDLELEF